MTLCTNEIEYAVARHFDWRQNIIVPNVSWGFGLKHEADLLIVSQGRWASEVEIKISASDLKRDAFKSHKHESNKILKLYFAIPDTLQKYIEFTDPRAGILIIDMYNRLPSSPTCIPEPRVKLIRAAKLNKLAHKLSDQEMLKLLRLACMRVWPLKQRMLEQYHQKHPMDAVK